MVSFVLTGPFISCTLRTWKPRTSEVRSGSKILCNSGPSGRRILHLSNPKIKLREESRKHDRHRDEVEGRLCRSHGRIKLHTVWDLGSLTKVKNPGGDRSAWCWPCVSIQHLFSLLFFPPSVLIFCSFLSSTSI